MLLRRALLPLPVMLLALSSGPAFSQTAQQATSFIRDVGSRLVAIVNGPGSAEQKKTSLARVIDSDVDVDGIARFCLGQYWRLATPQQRQEYEALFHQVLTISVTSKISDYQGVHFTVDRTTSRSEGQVVATTISGPQKAPTTVEWVVQNVGGSPKIIDLLAEGTSLRLTQRDDYASFISQHGGSLQALIEALHRQVSQNA